MYQGSFTDKEMIGDVLSSQKFITSGYNTVANEASEPTVKNAFMSILEEEHEIGHDVFMNMKSRGWYETEDAPQNKIDQAKQKFSQNCQNCF